MADNESLEKNPITSESLNANLTSRISCAYFVKRKNRFCKMSPVNADLKFCCQHIPISTTDGDALNAKQRITCPLDSKHSCYKDQLERHLKRCNAQLKAQPIFYERNVNSGINQVECQAKVTIGQIPDSTLISLLDRLENSYQKNVQLPTENVRSCALLERESANPSYGPSVLKHLKQNSSIIGILNERGLLENGNCFVEFGAGRGQLSHWIIQALNISPTSLFVLIDRASQRHKFDNKCSQEGLRLTRLKVDIEHLNLAKVPLAFDSEKVVAISKHLCGAATDLALNCLINYKNFKREHIDKNDGSIKGIFFALCCHHRCDWDHYLGRKYLENWGFDRHDFHILQSVSSWATCSARSASESCCLNQIPNPRYHVLDLPAEKRKDYGIKSKLLIDEGRARALREQGFLVELLTYTAKDISPENVGLLATFITS